MARRLSHVGVVVRDIEEALRVYTDVLGFAPAPAGIVTVEEMGVKSAMIPVGNNYIELIESTRPDSMPNRVLEKRGEGLLHIAVEVDDVDAEATSLKKAGASVMEMPPMGAIVNYKSAFVLPKSSKGVSIELVPKGTAHKSLRGMLGLEVVDLPLDS